MDCKRIFQRNFCIFLIIFLFTCNFIYFYPNVIDFKFQNSKLILTKQNLNIIDLSQPLNPADVYDPIQCRISAQFVIKALLCVHNKSIDWIISGEIMNAGYFEGYVLGPFMNFIYNNPDWLVIDVGANIGQYTLFAAKLGRKVISIEPFHDNLLRLHKAAYLAKTYDNIILLKHGLSNKRNEFKLLNQDNNIGGQSLLGNRDKVFTRDEKNKYLVETILFDDIVPYLPYKNKYTLEKFKKAIIKIDIEGFEVFAFEHASLLFDTLDIRIVIMEWYHTKSLPEVDKILKLIDFFYSRNYEPFDQLTLLTRDTWKNWPPDVFWKRNI